MVVTASANGISGGGGIPSRRAAKTIGSPGGVGASSVTLTTPSVPCAKAASIACAMSATWMRLNTWPGLGVVWCAPEPHIDQRILPGPIDAGEAQDRDRDLALPAERLPGLLGRDALARAVMRGSGRGRLVAPGAAVIAIDPDGRQQHHVAQPRRGGERVVQCAQHRVAVL